MEWHNYAAKEWGNLLARDINPSATSYEPKINSRIVQSDRNGDGARVATGEQEDKEQEVREGATGQITVTDKAQANVSVNGFWKLDTFALFEI